MGKNLPHMGPFTMSFEAEHIHPGVALIKEILQAFEDFMFLAHNPVHNKSYLLQVLTHETCHYVTDEKIYSQSRPADA